MVFNCPLNDKVIKLLKEGENYKYLGELEADELMVIEMKDKMKKEYDRRARKELKTNLNRQNVFKAIKIWQYQWWDILEHSGALGWSRLQLEGINSRTRKFLTMRNGFHLKSNVNRLYLSRSEGGRGLIGVQDTLETAILGLRHYVRNINKRTKRRKKSKKSTKWFQDEKKEWTENTVDTKTFTWTIYQANNG